MRVLGSTVLERVRLSRVVTRLTWDDGGVSVVTRAASGTRVTLEARAAIITVPLGVLVAAEGDERRIEFDPAIPVVERAASRLVMGGVLRVALRMDEPFWLTPRFVKRIGDTFREVTFIQALSASPVSTPALGGTEPWTARSHQVNAPRNRRCASSACASRQPAAS